MKKLLYKIRHSLAIRLLLLLLATMFSIMVVVSIIMAGGFKGQFTEVIKPHTHRYHSYLLAELGHPPNRDKALELAADLPLVIYIVNADGEWSTNGKPLGEIGGDEWHYGGSQDNYVEQDNRFLMQSQVGDSKVYLGFPEWRHSNKGKHLILILVFTILLLSYLAIRRLFKPLDAIKQGVKRFGNGELDHRIEVKRKDELGDLAAQVNHMASDIDDMLNAKRDLLLAISHELRSPITRSKVSLELMEQSDFSDAVKSDILEMESLISEILETERMNQRHAKLNRSDVDIAGLVRELSEELNADSNRIEVSENLQLKTVSLDRARIRLLLHNLLENALRHNRDELGKVKLELGEKGNHLEILISDHGAGIAAEHIPHLTEPFYRVDPSRQRKTGGYGLGLYLCEAIVKAHQGELEIISGAGHEGTTVRVQLPVQARSN